MAFTSGYSRREAELANAPYVHAGFGEAGTKRGAGCLGWNGSLVAMLSSVQFGAGRSSNRTTVRVPSSYLSCQSSASSVHRRSGATLAPRNLDMARADLQCQYAARS